MKNQQTIEDRIRQTLSAENDAVVLSNQLFSPNGLFNQLASTEAERRALVGTTLFKDAQRRLSILKRQEAQEFARTVEQFESSHGGHHSLHRMEHV